MDSQSNEAAGSEQTSELSTEAGRADTLNQPNPYGLPFSEDELRELARLLEGESLHYAIGFLVGAVSRREPMSLDDCLKELIEAGIQNDEDDSSLDDLDEGKPKKLECTPEAEKLYRGLIDHVQQRVAANGVASLIPIAQDADACEQWVIGLDIAVNDTMHDPTEEEANICLKILPRMFDLPLSGEPKRVNARETLVAAVTRLIQLWREVPPYEPADDSGLDEMLDDEPFPELGPYEPPANVFHRGGTYVRTEAKVGRNDLCPCGSGKKFKKCCG